MREIFESVISVIKSRLFPLAVFFITLFTILLVRLFNLQIVNGANALDDYNSSAKVSLDVPSTRGRIFDVNGVLLAYNELAFSIKISDSGTYSSSSQKNRLLNETIYQTIQIIEEHGDKVNCDYAIVVNSDGEYEFNVDGNSLLRFLRDSYGCSSISELSEEQKNSTAAEVIEYLSSKEVYGIDESYEKDDVIKIINFRSYMSANYYNRKMKFTVAYDVSDETVAAILENSGTLLGVTVEEDYIRKYENGFYAAHILGYTGVASTDELERLQALDEQYSANDVVGKAGIEEAMELELQGHKGEQIVYLDTVGRVTEVLEETPPVTGNDVYLTIDIVMQEKIYHAIERKLADIILSKLTPTDDVYEYASDQTTIKDIYIPIKDVYFALFDNNIISITSIAARHTDVESKVYDKFLTKQASVTEAVLTELTTSPTPYNKLSEEMQVYIYYISQMLKEDGVINTSNIDTSDSTYQEWVAETISLKDYLSYAIAKNWIDVSVYTDEEYSSLTEAYDALLDYIFDVIKTDSGFCKRLYRYMIKSGTLTGKEVCLLLYDQDVIVYEDELYKQLLNGRMSAYDFIYSKIDALEITPAQLALEPCSGAVVVLDTNTGKVLSLVSYPSYDINKLSGSVDAAYYSKLRNDQSLPLLNRATQTQTAPGSIFKIVSAVAGLESGVITPDEKITCTGIFTSVTPNPKCHIYPGRHGNENVSTAIMDSCNVFFYEVGYRLSMENGKYNSNLGTSVLAEYAQKLGLATESGIEIYEASPQASTVNSVASAIGQGSNNYSALNLARYASTIANSGICYDLTLIDKVTDSEGNLLYASEPVIASTMDDVKQSTWDAVHYGMKLVSNKTAGIYDLPVSSGSKSGTAQEKLTKPDHATYILYAPYENPEVAVSCVIPNGYTSSNVAKLTSDVLKIYYGLDEDENSTEQTNETGGVTVE